MADKQSVKVGDKVKSLVTQLDVREGATYEVKNIDFDGDIWVTDDVGDRFYLTTDEFELLPVAEATGKPAFKVGDRVKVGGDHPYILSNNNTTGKIIGGNNGRRGEWEVQLDNYGGSLSFKTDELKRLSSPVTIETGKFYRTRDERKVGPMDGWTSDRFRERAGDGRYWTLDGIGHCEAKGEDLIAEWVDALASKEPQKARAPFTLRNFTITFNEPWTTPAIVALIEKGQPKPSDQPKVHKSEQAATDEAERLAVKYPGQKFGVFVLADSRIADVVIRRAA